MNNSIFGMPGCDSLQRFSRRQMLTAAGGAGLFAVNPLTTLAEQLQQGQEQSDSRSKPAAAKALIFVWLQGGPSQLETFDPYPGTKIGGDTKAIKTTVAGLEIADCLPATAEQIHHATLIRSMVSKEGDHERATKNFKSGWRPEPTLAHPAIGSILAHASSTNIDLPLHISILPSQWPSLGGFLGPQLNAFTLGDPAQPLPNLVGRVDADRRATRLKMMTDIADREFLRGRVSDLESMRLQQRTTADRAVAMMDTKQLEAFDLKRETSEVRDRFGDTAFGRGCLAAVRLVQEGVRCVEVELSGWDSHVDNHGIQYRRAADLDAALAGLLQTLAERDMLESTIVLCSGEFGRTPSINVAGGRDHWPTGFSTLVAGGQFHRGQVHGETNSSIALDARPSVEHVVSPISIADLHATILSQCGIDPSEEVQTPIGRPIAWSEGQVRSELLQG